MKQKRWVGIFGGSFDPPHIAHLLAAVYALKMFELDEIWFIPAYQHAFQKKLTPFPIRFELCKALIKNMGPQFKVSTIEKDIRSDGKTLNTLLALRKKYKNYAFSLVVGSDILKQKKKWHGFDEIEKRFMILVVPRGSDGNSFSIPDLSSSEVRKRSQKNQTLEDLVPPIVANSIPKY